MRGYIPELLSTDAFNVPAQAAKVALFELTTARQQPQMTDCLQV